MVGSTRCSDETRPVNAPCAGLPEDGSPVAPTPGRPHASRLTFHESPFLVIWEVTQACDLACVHCRACAQPLRHPRELSTAEGFRLLEQIREFGRPLLVFSGGDPIKRPDIYELVAHAAGLGLRPSMTPSATPLVMREAIGRLKDAGLARMAISLDGPTAERHDAFRGVRGSFAATLDIVEWCREMGLPLQINTTITQHNVDDLDALYERVKSFPGMALWSVFFLVPTGRARAEDEALAEEYERVFHRLADVSREAPFDIKTTAAPHYRRVLLQRRKESGGVGERESGSAGGEAARRAPAGPGLDAGGVGRAARGVNDGNGFLFVSHTGEIFPSGFLPIRCGDVRTDHVVQVYRESPVFRALRDPDGLKGKCGVCEYRRICGGSRARAYALTGDYLESEPYCVYEPPAWKPTQDGE